MKEKYILYYTTEDEEEKDKQPRAPRLRPGRHIFDIYEAEPQKVENQDHNEPAPEPVFQHEKQQEKIPQTIAYETTPEAAEPRVNYNDPETWKDLSYNQLWHQMASGKTTNPDILPFFLSKQWDKIQKTHTSPQIYTQYRDGAAGKQSGIFEYCKQEADELRNHRHWEETPDRKLMAFNFQNLATAYAKKHPEPRKAA